MIEKLKKLGLTEYEARVYETLIRLNTATGGKVSKKSGVPHGKTYESLHSLAEKGLVFIVPLKPKLFKAIEPKKAIQSLINNKIEEMTELKKEITKSLIIKEKPKEKAYQNVNVSQGFNAVFNLFYNWENKAKKQILVYSIGERIPSKVYNQAKKLVMKGIDYRMIAFKFNEENKKDVKWLAKTGMKIRFYPGSEISFVICDKEESFIVIRSPVNTKIKDDRILIHFEDAEISKALAEYFETIWKKAKPVKF